MSQTDTSTGKPGATTGMSTLEHWARRLMGGNFDVHGTTYEQVVNSLRGAYDLIDKSTLDPERQRLSAQIEAGLKQAGMRRHGDGRAAWREARLIEQRMVGLFSGASLWTELHRRVDEAERLAMPEAAFYRAQLAEGDLAKFEPQADAAKQKRLDDLARALLLRVVTDLQATYTNRYVKTRYATRAVRRASWVFGLSFLTFILVLVVFTFERPADTSQPPAKPPAETN